MSREAWDDSLFDHMKKVVENSTRLHASPTAVGNGLVYGADKYSSTCMIYDISTSEAQYVAAAINEGRDMLREIERLRLALREEQERRVSLERRLEAMEHFRKSFNAAIEQVGHIAGPWDTDKENE